MPTTTLLHCRVDDQNYQVWSIVPGSVPPNVQLFVIPREALKNRKLYHGYAKLNDDHEVIDQVPDADLKGIIACLAEHFDRFIETGYTPAPNLATVAQQVVSAATTGTATRLTGFEGVHEVPELDTSWTDKEKLTRLVLPRTRER